MPASTPWLLCRAGGDLCALPLPHVIEVMRPLPVTPLAQLPELVLGVCVMRGVPTPVIDLARCLSGSAAAPTRFVAVRSAPGSDARRLALAVDAVCGAILLDPERVQSVPALLSQASAALTAVTTVDTSLVMLLQTARLLSELQLPELASHAPHA